MIVAGAPPVLATTEPPTLSSALFSIVNEVPSVTTIYPVSRRWLISRLADDRISTVRTADGLEITIHVGVSVTSTARRSGNEVYAAVSDYLRDVGAAVSAVNIKVCSIG